MRVSVGQALDLRYVRTIVSTYLVRIVTKLHKADIEVLSFGSQKTA